MSSRGWGASVPVAVLGICTSMLSLACADRGDTFERGPSLATAESALRLDGGCSQTCGPDGRCDAAPPIGRSCEEACGTDFAEGCDCHPGCAAAGNCCGDYAWRCAQTDAGPPVLVDRAAAEGLRPERVVATTIDASDDGEWVVVGGANSAQNNLYRRQQNGLYEDVTANLRVTAAGDLGEQGQIRTTAGALVADFDLDGLDDVLFGYANRTDYNGTPRTLYRGAQNDQFVLDTTTTFEPRNPLQYGVGSRYPLHETGFLHRLAKGDFDGDGDVDIFLATAERNMFYENLAIGRAETQDATYTPAGHAFKLHTVDPYASPCLYRTRDVVVADVLFQGHPQVIVIRERLERRNGQNVVICTAATPTVHLYALNPHGASDPNNVNGTFPEHTCRDAVGSCQPSPLFAARGYDVNNICEHGESTGCAAGQRAQSLKFVDLFDPARPNADRATFTASHREFENASEIGVIDIDANAKPDIVVFREHPDGFAMDACYWDDSSPPCNDPLEQELARPLALLHTQTFKFDRDDTTPLATFTDAWFRVDEAIHLRDSYPYQLALVSVRTPFRHPSGAHTNFTLVEQGWPWPDFVTACDDDPLDATLVETGHEKYDLQRLVAGMAGQFDLQSGTDIALTIGGQQLTLTRNAAGCFESHMRTPAGEYRVFRRIIAGNFDRSTAADDILGTVGGHIGNDYEEERQASPALYLGDGADGFTNASHRIEEATSATPPHGQADAAFISGGPEWGSTAIDYDGDGDDDIAVSAAGGLQLFENELPGAPTFVEATAKLPIGASASLAALVRTDEGGSCTPYGTCQKKWLAAGDLDGNGYEDLVMAGYQSFNDIFFFDPVQDRFVSARFELGAGTLLDATDADGAGSDNHAMRILVDDFDADGAPDVLVSSVVYAANNVADVLFLNRIPQVPHGDVVDVGDVAFDRHVLPPRECPGTVEPLHFYVGCIGSGDINHDGLPDIVLGSKPRSDESLPDEQGRLRLLSCTGNACPEVWKCTPNKAACALGETAPGCCEKNPATGCPAGIYDKSHTDYCEQFKYTPVAASMVSESKLYLFINNGDGRFTKIDADTLAADDIQDPALRQSRLDRNRANVYAECDIVDLDRDGDNDVFAASYAGDANVASDLFDTDGHPYDGVSRPLIGSVHAMGRRSFLRTDLRALLNEGPYPGASRIPRLRDDDTVFERHMNWGKVYTATVADVDADPAMEIVIGAENRLHILDD